MAKRPLLAVCRRPSRLRPDRWPRGLRPRAIKSARMRSQGVWSDKAVQEAIEEPVWLFHDRCRKLAPVFRRVLASSRKVK